ncbi:type II toxin-antitoxin system RelE/ParE family toxin [bacterium]|nr:MAG: type II toxin-antitoxin system RelE/ParE family toxin [bacterium]
MSEPSLVLKKTPEFHDWYSELSETERTRVDARLDRAKQGHFGASRDLGEGLLEFKWANGMRIYYSRKRIQGIDVLVLWGGFKGTQKGDIRKARRLKAEYEHDLEN